MTGLLKNILWLPKITLDKKLNVIEFRRKKMEPLVLFLIKEISSFYTRSSILYFITTVYFYFTSILHSLCLSIYFHCLVCLILKFFLVGAIDMSLIIIIKITISNYWSHLLLCKDKHFNLIYAQVFLSMVMFNNSFY